MLTVPEAARRIGKDPETVRRWIRSGRLRARKIGTQHVIEEQDLAAVAPKDKRILRPKAWREAWKHPFPEPDWAAWVRASRDRH